VHLCLSKQTAQISTVFQEAKLSMFNSLVIIPCYNEAKRIELDAFKEGLKSINGLNLLFVNDGSSDDTAKILADFCGKQERAHFIDKKINQGKAEAIRTAVNSAALDNYDYVGYFDADLATPLNELPRMFKLIQEKNQPYMLVGSRVKLLGLTQIKRKLSRHYIGRVFATIVSNMLKLSIYDTQCGAKLIRKDICGGLFEKPFASKWLFDVELFFRLKKIREDYNLRIIEMPLMKWEDKAGSKIGFTYYLQAPFDLLRIYLKYR
jgi:glycosyltransferase involved in cell wall biosynthesis